MATSTDNPTSEPFVLNQRETLQKSFGLLEAHRFAITRCLKGWKIFDKDVAQIQQALDQKLAQIQEKEKEFEASLKEREEALDKRENLIESRENASIARIQEQKETAIASILDQRKKWLEERNLTEAQAAKLAELGGGKTNSQVDKKVESLITEVNAVEGKEADNKGSSKDIAGNADRKVEDGAKDEQTALKKVEGTKNMEVRSQLISFCEKMDGPGLWKYLAQQKKEFNVLQKEMPSALKHAAEPVPLVLKALETHNVATSGMNKKKPTLNRRQCILLLECLTSSPKDDRIKFKSAAKEIADMWKSKLNLENTDIASLAEVHSFLQLVDTFQLLTDYREDELCKLAVFVAGRKQIPKLCRALGLSARVPDMVNMLIKDKKRIEAIAFIYEFNLTEVVPPGPLLRDHIKDIEEGDNVVEQLAAVKAVLKCITEHHLDAETSPESLKKRVAELEKKKSEVKNAEVQGVQDDTLKKAAETVQIEEPKPEKRRISDPVTPTPKKPRAMGFGGPPHSAPSHSGHSFRPQFGAGGGPYNMPNPYSMGYGVGGGRGGYPRPLGDGRGSFYGNQSYQYPNYPYSGIRRPGYPGPYMR